MKHQITSEEELRELMGDPVHELVVVKSSPVITETIKRYIEMSPFACLATHSDDGSSDLSPRGDPPGFVHIQDEKTLIFPERPGNKRLDSIINIIRQQKLSLLFMIPGVLETVRVNGSGIVSTDPALLALFPINGKLPELVVVVTVEEAFGHCSKAFRRSRLWTDEYLPTQKVPTLAELMTDHLGLDEATHRELEEGIKNDVDERMH